MAKALRNLLEKMAAYFEAFKQPTLMEMLDDHLERVIDDHLESPPYEEIETIKGIEIGSYNVYAPRNENKIGAALDPDCVVIRFMLNDRPYSVLLDSPEKVDAVIQSLALHKNRAFPSRNANIRILA